MLAPFLIIKAGIGETREDRQQKTVALVMAVLPDTLTKEAARDAICDLCKALDEYVFTFLFCPFLTIN
jgi:hypothetical protein